MRVCNAGQPNLKDRVPRVSLIYRSAPVNYAKRDAFWYSFCILFRGTIFNLKKKCSSDDLLMHFASNHEMSLSKSKNFFKTLFFAAEKIDYNRLFGLENRLKPTIWRSKNRLK